MNPLFNQNKESQKNTNLETSISRVIDILLPELTKIKYSLTFHKTSILGSGILFQLFLIREPEKAIFIVPWIRTEVYSVKSLAKSVADYPRLNVASTFKDESNKEKIRLMLELVKKFDLYFLVMVPRPNSNHLYWLDKYENIPIESWKLTYRTDPKNLDRIHLPGYNDSKFVKLKQLEEILKKIIK